MITVLWNSNGAPLKVYVNGAAFCLGRELLVYSMDGLVLLPIMDLLKETDLNQNCTERKMQEEAVITLGITSKVSAPRTPVAYSITKCQLIIQKRHTKGTRNFRKPVFQKIGSMNFSDMFQLVKLPDYTNYMDTLNQQPKKSPF